MVRVGAGVFSAVTHPYASRNNPTATTISTAQTAKTRVKKSVVSLVLPPFSFSPHINSKRLFKIFYSSADFHGSTFLVSDWYSVLNKTQLQVSTQPDGPQIEINSTCCKSQEFIHPKLILSIIFKYNI